MVQCQQALVWSLGDVLDCHRASPRGRLRYILLAYQIGSWLSWTRRWVVVARFWTQTANMLAGKLRSIIHIRWELTPAVVVVRTCRFNCTTSRCNSNQDTSPS